MTSCNGSGTARNSGAYGLICLRQITSAAVFQRPMNFWLPRHRCVTGARSRKALRAAAEAVDDERPVAATQKQDGWVLITFPQPFGFARHQIDRHPPATVVQTYERSVSANVGGRDGRRLDVVTAVERHG